MSLCERPGVYTSYQVTGSLTASGSGGAVGLAAAQTGTAGQVTAITSYAQALAAFSGGNMVELIKILLKNGAPVIYATPVSGTDYAGAFAALMQVSQIKYMLCDSHAAAQHSAMKTAITGGDEAYKYRIGIVETGETARAGLVSAAAALNSERIMLVSHAETEGTAGAVAAAVCGAIAAQTDPAVPLNGAVLQGLGATGANFSDGDIDLLIQGGVTPIETTAGEISVVRGITTRTTTGGAADTTWREINTVLIIDDVIPAIRDGLRARFARAKNTAQTRGAIRTQVMIELENRVRAEIIDGYGDVTAQPGASDGTICQVGFSFTVVRGLNRIELSADITV